MVNERFDQYRAKRKAVRAKTGQGRVEKSHQQRVWRTAIVSYRLSNESQFTVRVCAAQQTCISATLQPLLQSAAMSVMRLTARTGSDEPQVSNELEVCHERADGRFEACGFNLRLQNRRGRNARSLKELEKWRSSKHATWSNGLGA
jgi:hypothetical protein